MEAGGVVGCAGGEGEKFERLKMTYGEICAGIGGFGLGFERAGWRCGWTIELDDVNREVLNDRFPGRPHKKDLRDWRSYRNELCGVDAILSGFPCQDISVMGQHAGRPKGLEGGRSGLVFEVLEIVEFFRPKWMVFENVPALLSSNGGRDFERLLGEVTKRGYCGFFRVLDAQYFGVPQKRRRLFMVFGLGRMPSMEFLADAAAVEAVSCSLGQGEERAGEGWAGYTLTAPDKYRKCKSRINFGSEVLIAEENGWDQMVERAGASGLSGVSSGLDATHSEEAWAAGNAVCPAIAEWIAEILNRS